MKVVRWERRCGKQRFQAPESKMTKGSTAVVDDVIYINQEAIQIILENQMEDETSLSPE